MTGRRLCPRPPASPLLQQTSQLHQHRLPLHLHRHSLRSALLRCLALLSGSSLVTGLQQCACCSRGAACSRRAGCTASSSLFCSRNTGQPCLRHGAACVRQGCCRKSQLHCPQVSPGCRWTNTQPGWWIQQEAHEPHCSPALSDSPCLATTPPQTPCITCEHLTSSWGTGSSA